MPSKYFTIASDLEEKIPHFLKNNQNFLPSEHTLCEEYHVSRQTIRNALSLLSQNGYIISEQGRGYQLTGKLPAGNNSICMLFPEDDAYIYPSVIKSLQTSFQKLGFDCKVFYSNNRYSTEASILKRLITNPPKLLIIEGIMTALSNPNIPLIANLIELGTKVFFIGSPYLTEFNSIGFDYNHEGQQVTKQLLELGHQKIMGVFPGFSQDGLAMHSGWMSEMINKSNIDYEPYFYLYGREILTSIRTNNKKEELIEQLLPNISGSTAIVCFNDEIAYWLIRELSEYGYVCPDDVSITGGDGSYLSRLSNPIISTWENPDYIKEIIKYAGQVLSGTAKKHNIIKRTFVDTNSISRINPIGL